MGLEMELVMNLLSPLSFCIHALYCTVLYCTVLYCTVLYCTVLYCTVAMKVLPIFRAESGVYAWARIWGIIIGYKTIQLRPVRERSTVLGNVQI